MTVEVASQAGYAALVQSGGQVASQTAYVVLTSPVVAVAAQTAYAVLLEEVPPPSLARRRPTILIN